MTIITIITKLFSNFQLLCTLNLRFVQESTLQYHPSSLHHSRASPSASASIASFSLSAGWFLDFFVHMGKIPSGFIQNSNISQVYKTPEEKSLQNTWLTQPWIRCLPLAQSAVTRSPGPCCTKGHKGTMA